MRALSIWQPWASAVACGAKQIETRSFATEYRGLIAIHASKRCVKKEMQELNVAMDWWKILGLPTSESPFWEQLPFGAVIAVATLADCRPAESFTSHEIDRMRGSFATERLLGDFKPGRFGWTLANVRALSKPLPYKGAQGFFHVPDRLIEAAL